MYSRLPEVSCCPVKPVSPGLVGGLLLWLNEGTPRVAARFARVASGATCHCRLDIAFVPHVVWFESWFEPALEFENRRRDPRRWDRFLIWKSRGRLGYSVIEHSIDNGLVLLGVTHSYTAAPLT
jgi:hypothetical protein